MSITSRLTSCSQGLVADSQDFMIVGVVKDGMSTSFKNFTNIDNPQNKAFILCGCPTANGSEEIMLYFSNDPIDFIRSPYNLGIIPCTKRDDILYLDMPIPNRTRTIGLPKTAKFSTKENIELNNVKFSSIGANQISSFTRIYHGTPYKLNFDDDKRMDFYVRKNQTTGRIGPSIAWFNQPSTIFEYLKTDFFAADGTSFVYNNDNFGISRLSLETNSQPFSDVPQGVGGYNNFVKIEQGTSTWYNMLSNPHGISSNLSLDFENLEFLNTYVYQPDTSKGISVQINLRNREDNFTSIPTIATSSNEVFDYYFVTLGGFEAGGFAHNSSQYIVSGTEITGGLCYYFSEDQEMIAYLNNLPGLINMVNCLNNTQIHKTTIDTSLVTSRTSAQGSANSDHNGARNAVLVGLDTSQSSTCGKGVPIGNEKPNPCLLKNNPDMSDPNAEIFSDNPQDQEITYLIEIIVMTVLVVVYLIFAFYYNSMTLNQK